MSLPFDQPIRQLPHRGIPGSTRVAIISLAVMTFGLVAAPVMRGQPIVIQNPTTSTRAGSPTPTAPTPPLPTGAGTTPPTGSDQLLQNNGSVSEPGDASAFNVEPLETSPSEVLPKWKFNFGAQATGFYESNIFITPTNEVHDYVFELAPYVELAWGDYRDKEGSFGGLKYTAIARHYDANDGFDHIDQDAVLQLQIRLTKTRFNFDFVYKSLSTPDIDLGGLNERQIFTGHIGAEYDLTGKTSLNTDFSAAFRESQKGLSSETYFGNLWLNSFVKPKLQLGVGVEVGLLKQQGSPEQTYGEVLMRGRYVITEKISLRAKVGLDYRDNRQSPFNVVGSLGLEYKPSETTRFSLEVGRTIIASSSQIGTNINGTAVTARVQKLVFQRIRLSLAAGYTNADYVGATSNATRQPRNDNIYFITPEIAYQIRHWLAVSVFYTYNRDDSSDDRYSFTDNIVGIRMSGDF